MPNNPNLELKANDLVEQINAFRGRGKVTQVQLARLKREARALLKADAHGAYVVLGALAALEKNDREMREQHERAIRLNPDDEWARINYATSLRNLGFVAEALSQVHKLFIDQPDNLGALEHAIAYAVGAGNIHLAQELIQEWRIRKPGEKHFLEDLCSEYTRSLESHEVSDEMAQEFVSAALEHLHNEGVFPEDTSAFCLGGDIHVRIELDADTNEIVRLNETLADTLVERNLVPGASSAMTVTYVPVAP